MDRVSIHLNNVHCHINYLFMFSILYVCPYIHGCLYIEAGIREWSFLSPGGGAGHFVEGYQIFLLCDGGVAKLFKP